ncbi:rCG29116, partial [Rattus norvegicus]
MRFWKNKTSSNHSRGHIWNCNNQMNKIPLLFSLCYPVGMWQLSENSQQLINKIYVCI